MGPRRYSRLELVGAVVDRGGIVDKNRCRKGRAAVGRLRQLHVNPAVALNLKSEQHMAVGWVDGHVVGDAVTERGVWERRRGYEAKLRRQGRASECLAPIGGLQQPDVRLRRKVRRKASIADVERAISAGAQENVGFKAPTFISNRKFHRRRKVLSAVG